MMNPFLKISVRIMTVAIATSLLAASFPTPTLQSTAQTSPPPNEPDMDNIYHEDENLPDDADVFPRMGHTAGASWERNNCRISPWGTVVRTLPGDAFFEVNNRVLDRNDESWFFIQEIGCWVHDSRIDLL
ncbi:MAG: hypothetical protein VKK04_13925 [Synechococcales bacterium]|nr:hypothetical protein [Synechococcales bacterium]